MEKRWRFMFLSSMWFFSCAGITVIVSGTTMPLYVRTTVYLMLGWMGLLLYFQLLKKLTERKARPFMMGGIIYSLGAAFNLAHQPVIIPGLVGPHEVFHMVVIIGSLMHYYFMIKTVACYSKPSTAPSKCMIIPSWLVPMQVVCKRCQCRVNQLEFECGKNENCTLSDCWSTARF